jgi:hypothetical protein
MWTGECFRPLLTAFQMRKIGYAGVSSPDQNLDRQIAALRGEGCDKLYREKASGKDIRNPPQLEKAIDMLATGDVLVAAEWGSGDQVNDGRDRYHRPHQQAPMPD